MVWRRSVGDGPRPGQRRHELILPAYGLCRQTLSLQLADNLQLECFTISNCWFVPDLFGSRVSIYSRRSDYGSRITHYLQHRTSPGPLTNTFHIRSGAVPQPSIKLGLILELLPSQPWNHHKL